jgi:hypothetical protein
VSAGQALELVRQLDARGFRGTLGDPVASMLGATASCTLSGSDSKTAAFNGLPDDVRCAFYASVPAGVQDATAAASLASTIAAGGTPNPGAIIAGLGGVATIVGGPVAGAVLATAGAVVTAFSSVLQALFQALGLYPPPLASFTYNGLQRLGVDPIPYGPTDAANWLPFTRYQDLDWVGGPGWGKWGPSPTQSIGGRPDYNPSPAEAASPWQTGAIAMLRACLYFAMTPTQRYAWDQGAWSGGVYLPGAEPATVPLSPDGGLPPGPMGAGSYATLPPFEEFVRTLLLADLQYWANAWPYVPPHDLLTAAVHVWNAGHNGPADINGTLPPGGVLCSTRPPSSLVTCYQPTPSNDLATVGGNLIAFMLTGGADSSGNNQQLPPMAVNAPPAVLPTRGLLTPSGRGGTRIATLPTLGGSGAPGKSSSATTSSATGTAVAGVAAAGASVALLALVAPGALKAAMGALGGRKR